MESFETSFVRNKQDILITHDAGIKTCAFEDYVIASHTIDSNELFIHPGIIIKQENQIISGRRPNGTIVFNYRSSQKLHGFILDTHRLFALDSHSHIHIHSSATTSPEILDISRRPLGWKVIHKTKNIVYWTSISMHAYIPETDQTIHLRAHHARVTAVATNMTTVVSGDSAGHVCIWYVSSWQCHHNLATGPTSCKDICLCPESQVCVLSLDLLRGYDLATGLPTFSVEINAQYLLPIANGILVSDEQRIALFKNGVCYGCFKSKHKKMIEYVGDRFYICSNTKIIELWLNSIFWPEECLEWIQNPTLPFDKSWTRRYMDVLALSADLWIPRVAKNWEPPKQWFRHEKLRDAIWDTVIATEMEVSYSWRFLTPHIMKKWYQKNIDAILSILISDKFDRRVVHLLHRVFKHVRIENKDIQRWCWHHHDRSSLKPILTYLLATDESFLNIAQCYSISPDAIRCLSPIAIKLGLSKGHLSFFIRCLQAFHKQYVTPPSHHMHQIFQQLLTHIYLHIHVETMDLPLPESGTWTPLTRPVPLNIGAFIRCGRTTGFITDIQFQPNVVMRWKPLNRTSDIILSDSESVDIWKYKYDSGPYTMLECALTLLSKEAWASEARIQPWKWYTTEMGAFEAETISIRVFDIPMRIMKATIDPVSILTSTQLQIDESEKVLIHSVTPLWSYHKEHLYHIAPLRLKIGQLIGESTRAPLSIIYAHSLLQNIQSKTICQEHRWRTPQRVSSMASDMGMFFMGFESGDICEYYSTADITPIRHFTKHINSILSILIFDTRMVTLCEDEMNIWCLDSGTNIFTATSQMHFTAAIPAGIFSTWIIETDEEQTIVSLWDIVDEHIVKRIPVDINGINGTILTTNTPAIIVNNKVLTLDSNAKEFTIPEMRGDITCAVSTTLGICAGTSKGTVFIINSKDMHEWSSTNTHAITAMAAMDNQPYVVTGSASGEIAIWDIQKTGVVTITHLSNTSIDNIHFENMFAIVTQHTTVHLLTIVQERCMIAVNTMQKIASWSHVWKSRLLNKTTTLVIPAIIGCILNETGVAEACTLSEKCTEEYADRLEWCRPEFVDILLEAPKEMAKKLLQRLASFRGPKLDCVICSNNESNDLICFLKTCQHRFHTGCIAELIRKTPEYHREMQYEYALEVSLKCPTCRHPFSSEDVAEDVFLSQFCQTLKK